MRDLDTVMPMEKCGYYSGGGWGTDYIHIHMPMSISS